MSDTKLFFLSHACVLIRYKEHLLLTDPWYLQPAFGSWLPNPPPIIHPSYLTALSRSTNNFTILISHGHDDHLDDELLPLFNPATNFVTANFKAPSVLNRIKKSGFFNIFTIPPEGFQQGPFFIRGFVDPNISHDDAVYSIRTPDSLVVHANDCWNELDDSKAELIRTDVMKIPKGNTIYMSQTNSASGYPLNYQNYGLEEKRELLRKKIAKMIQTGLNNAKKVGIKNFLSYAGYTSTFVADKSEYIQESFLPTPRNIKKTFSNYMVDGVEILDMVPGDIFDFNVVHKNIVNEFIDSKALFFSTIDYYKHYNLHLKCDTFRDLPDVDLIKLKNDLQKFLIDFDVWVRRRLEKDGFHPEIMGKTLSFQIADTEIIVSIKFGTGIIKATNYNKKIIVNPKILRLVLDGKILLENLTTGYEAEISRNPSDVYNRDFIMYIVMYSYVYKRNMEKADLKMWN